MISGKGTSIQIPGQPYTQAEVAAYLGYTSSGSLSFVERGLMGMSEDKIAKAAELFGIHEMAMTFLSKIPADELEDLSSLLTLYSASRTDDTARGLKGAIRTILRAAKQEKLI